MANKLIGLGFVTALMFSIPASGDSLWHTFTTSTDYGTKYLVSAEGNLQSIESPTGFSHLGDIEGYILCYAPPNLPEIRAYDFTGLDPSSATNFGPAIASAASPWTVTRNTSDGRLRFTQVFTFDATSKSLNITMTLKNLTGSTINDVVLNRVAALIIDGGSFRRKFMHIHDAVFGWNDPITSGPHAHGVLLRHLKESAGGYHGGVLPLDPYDCNTLSVSGNPATGPQDGLMHYSYPSIAAGASKSVTIQYVRD